jgi:glutaredoxin 3
MAKVEVYCTLSCGYCARAIRLLDNKGVEYQLLRLDQNPALREEMENRSKRTSVPQIFIDDVHVGGFDDMAELDMDDKLDPMLGIK